MNDDRERERFSVAKLASIMKLNKVGELENYFTGKEEPTFEFIDRFASCFGVNPDWMKFGEDTPYQSSEYAESSPLDYLKRIKELNPKSIIFVRDDSEDGESGIVLQLEEWKYVVLPDIYSISSNVGGTGSSDIFSFYQLIIKLDELDETETRLRCEGRIIDSETMERLFSGTVFPGVLTLPGKRNSNWWYCFTDVYHQFYTADE